MKLRFGLHYGVGFISQAIRWQQRSDVSHTSLILSDNSLLEAREFRGVVRERTLDQARSEIRVDVVAIDVPADRWAPAMNFAFEQLGKKYDYASVLRFVTRRQCERTDNGEWFCSELTFVIAQKAGVTLLRNIEPWAVSPGLFSYSPLWKVE